MSDEKNNTENSFENHVDDHSSVVPDETAQIERKQGVFDHIGDFFKIMTLGILKFTFYTAPIFLFKNLPKILRWICKYLYSVGRAIFWCAIWLLIVFAAWIAFGLKQFIHFWRWVGEQILNMGGVFLRFIIDNAGPIWFIIAIIGSIYGLLYITLKRRAHKRNIPFSGVFSFLKHRKFKKKDSGN